ncbi:LacI family DNA-binding transcriptional regulator [Niabella aurantiaca]|uniref:LacI family DNA-binding transcriptional regulator n=1 Tax=Niabella aurantiaca TaxID=379900 RepID=UPI00036C8E27|nr:LacI family DNA-binding transcriptional regulator [Niabella aurantiaca]
MEKQVTIYDLARALNLSTATISRALDNSPLVKPHTREKIRAMAEKMGYRQNLIARNLRKQQSRTIGVLLHEVNSYFATSVLAGIEKITTREKYDILIAHSGEDGGREIANTRNLFNKRVDGLIVSLAMNTSATDHFNPFFEQGIPVVFFDRVVKKMPCSKIVIDNFKAGYQATAHLLDQGYRRIAHITASLQRNVYEERLRGYKKALADRNIRFSPELVESCSLNREDTLEAMNKLLAQKPDAFFVTNDFAAAVCMDALQQSGIRIPGDMGVIGFNNDILGSLISPKLSTIDYPGLLMGETAAQTLIEKIKTKKSGKGTPEGKNVTIPSSLIIRESTGKKDRAGRSLKS